MEFTFGRQIGGKLLPCSHLFLVMLSALLYFCLPFILLSATTVKGVNIQRLVSNVPSEHGDQENGERHIRRARRAAGVPMDMGGVGRLNPMIQNNRIQAPPLVGLGNQNRPQQRRRPNNPVNQGQFNPLRYQVNNNKPIETPNDGIIKDAYYISKQTEVRDYLGLAPLPPLHAREFSSDRVRRPPGNANRQNRQQYHQPQRSAVNQQLQPMKMPGFQAGQVNLDNLQPRELTDKQQQIVLEHEQQQQFGGQWGVRNRQQLQQRNWLPLMPGEQEQRQALGLQRLSPFNHASPQVRAQQTENHINFIDQKFLDRHNVYTKHQELEEWTVNMWEVEGKDVSIVCPKEMFIAEIDFAVVSKVQTRIFTVKDKIDRQLSPEKDKVKFRILKPQPKARGGNDLYLSGWHKAMDEIKDEAQSSLSETGCDPILYCLGHQSCHFTLWGDFCAVKLSVKLRLRMTYKCVRDSSLNVYLGNEEDRKLIINEKDQVLNLYHPHEENDVKSHHQNVTVIELVKTPEEEIFEVSCPPVSDAYKLG